MESVDVARNLNALVDYISLNFPSFAEVQLNSTRLRDLTDEKAALLLKILKLEKSGEPTYSLREKNYGDFYKFDAPLKDLFSEIITSRLPLAPVATYRDSSFFTRDASTEQQELTELLALGYRISSHKLTTAQLKDFRREIENHVFENRGIFQKELKGRQIFSAIDDGSITQNVGLNGDTFWVKDQNGLAQSALLRKLAFDPYILSMVSQYLGCVPIHVQTNVWFSFPTLKDKNNLSTNAQMYHQDKEFLKFIKVFIYLSDVGPENGPHAYVVGSHIDEAHTHGFNFSDRISDEDVIKFYSKDRIRSLVGPAGTITFGDTSCVHKGVPVEAGYRLMLQLEYASSLYLSPVEPFSDFPNEELKALSYPDDVTKRLTANYSSNIRAEYREASKRQSAAQPSTLRKLLRMAKRYAVNRL